MYFSSFIGNGVFPNPSTGMQITASGSSMTVTMRPGRGWINGYFIFNDADHQITIDPSHSTLKRIDRIVMQLNFFDRAIKIVVKKGVNASSPVAPSLQRDTDFYELGLADILVSNGAMVITQANITDLRLNSQLCGIVQGVVNQVDTTTIFNQYQDWFDDYSVEKATEFETWKSNLQNQMTVWVAQETSDFETWVSNSTNAYNEWIGTKQQEFIDWFNTIREVLDGDSIGNLQNQIDDHISARLPHIQTDDVTGIQYRTGWVIENGDLFFEYEEV